MNKSWKPGFPWVAALVVLVSGCAIPVNQDPGVSVGPETVQEPSQAPESEPLLAIDESLPVAYQQAVLDGLVKWQEAGFQVPQTEIVPGPEANVKASNDCLGVDPIAAGCALPGSHIHFVIDAVESDRWLTPEFVALHELGHFLGITWHLEDGNVMQPGTGHNLPGLTHPMPPTELTSADIEALTQALNPAGT